MGRLYGAVSFYYYVQVVQVLCDTYVACLLLPLLNNDEKLLLLLSELLARVLVAWTRSVQNLY